MSYKVSALKDFYEVRIPLPRFSNLYGELFLNIVSLIIVTLAGELEQLISDKHLDNLIDRLRVQHVNYWDRFLV